MLRGKSIKTLQELEQDEIYAILSRAKELKSWLRMRKEHQFLKGKTIALLFEKPSTRTRVSFEVAIAHLGAEPIYLDSSDLQISRGESIEDTAKVLSRYVDAIVMRTYSQDRLNKLAYYSSVPVINALTDDFHPCQILADFLTIYEKKRRLSDLKLAYVGDGNNIAQTLLIGCSKLKMDIWVSCPNGYAPKKEVIDLALTNAKGESIVKVINDPKEAVKGADIIYTDTWVSMGQEEEAGKKRKVFQFYQVNEDLVSLADESFIFMHCLPAHRGEEVVGEIIDGKHSVVFEQAENRLHIQKALLNLIM